MNPVNICSVWLTLESRINEGYVYYFLKILEGKKMKNDRNALIDVKMNINYGVIFLEGGYVYSRGYVFPDSRVKT